MQTIPHTTLTARIIGAFRAFAQHYPNDGSLTADALLTVARYTRARLDISAVERHFPHPWQAAAAAGILYGHGAVAAISREPAFQRLPAEGVSPASASSSSAGRWLDDHPARALRPADGNRGGSPGPVPPSPNGP